MAKMHHRAKRVVDPHTPNVRSEKWHAEHKKRQMYATKRNTRIRHINNDPSNVYKVYVEGKLAGLMYSPYDKDSYIMWRDYRPATGQFAWYEEMPLKGDPSCIGRKAIADFLCITDDRVINTIKKWKMA